MPIRGPALRIGYADPPYPGQAKTHYEHHPDYAGEVDHAELIKRLERDYDGWVLHTSSTDGLRVCLPLIPKEARVMAWVKPFAAFKRNVSVAYAWEPVIVKACRKPVVRHRIVMRDFVSESITMKKGLTGAKPLVVCQWAFEMVGAEPWDDLDDLYPGTGAVMAAWRAWQEDVTEGDDMAQTIQERIAAAKERAAKALAQAEALERKAAEGPKRRSTRSTTEINEIRLLEEQMKKRYGVGYSGLAEITRKAKKDGVPMPQPTGMANPGPSAGEGADAVAGPVPADEEPDMHPDDAEIVRAPVGAPAESDGDDAPPW